MSALPLRQALIPLIVACALFMENLDSTVISTALPAIAHTLGQDPLRMNLAITSYLLSLAVFIPLSSWMADKFGARNVFRAAIIIFVLGSILCGFSNSLATFVASRILQGMGGAMMVPVGRMVLLTSVPKDQLLNAMAYVTIPGLLGPVLGPPVGGFFVDYFNWRWIFFINIPIGLLGLLLATLYIPDQREENAGKLDILGFIYAGVGLAGVVMSFETVGRGLLPEGVVAALMVAGVAGLALLIHHSRRAKNPLVDLTLLSIKTYNASLVGGFVFRVGIGSLSFLMPLLLQIGFGYSAVHSGLTTFASALGAMAMKTTARPIIARYGFKRVLIVNSIISGVFFTSFALFKPDTPELLIIALLLVSGFFRSLQFTALNTVAFADISSQRVSKATSLSSVGQQLGLSMGVGIGALLLHFFVAQDGGSLSAASFPPVFAILGLVLIVSSFCFWNLASDAGSEVSGRKFPMPAGGGIPPLRGAAGPVKRPHS
ncbi:DHA2 family efflux MFS transporter permease subunit [Radicibacter daui]|uniref:DHA2 family efflux MFS transporter permease subunit n=1 Tax=Radicibacter daui TaxID=3064829 RepID=UPI0040469F26